MPFYPPERRRGPFPSSRQGFGPPRPNPFRRPNESYYNANQFDFRQGQQPFNPYQQQQQPFNPYQQQQQQPFNPYQQPQPSRLGGLTDNFDMVMGHMGRITNGVNMMRQLGGIMNIFR